MPYHGKLLEPFLQQKIGISVGMKLYESNGRIWACRRDLSNPFGAELFSVVNFWFLDRDSVVAERTRNNILPLCDFRPEDVDEDLIWRIQDLLVKSRKYIDIPGLRGAFKLKSNQGTTTVDVSVVGTVP